MSRASTVVALRNERVELRPHGPESLPSFMEWYADPELARLTRHDQRPLTPGQIRAFFYESVLPMADEGHSFGIHTVDSGRLVGTCALTDFTRDGHAATLRILLGPHDTWGRGYGTAAVELLVCYGFERLGLQEVILGVFDFNRRAIRSYEKVGFRQVATIRLHMPQGSPPASEVLMTLRAVDFQRSR